MHPKPREAIKEEDNKELSFISKLSTGALVWSNWCFCFCLVKVSYYGRVHRRVKCYLFYEKNDICKREGFYQKAPKPLGDKSKGDCEKGVSMDTM